MIKLAVQEESIFTSACSYGISNGSLNLGNCLQNQSEIHNLITYLSVVSTDATTHRLKHSHQYTVAPLKRGPYSSPSRQNPRTTLAGRITTTHQRPKHHCRRFFCACGSVLWRLCAGHLRVCRCRCSRSANPRTAATLNLLGRKWWKLYNE